MKLDWETLRCFVAVVEGGSLTAAAKTLAVSQPTVGRRIKELEKMMALDLLQRNQDQYVTTESGDAIYALARQMRDKAWAIECKAAEDTTRLSGRVVFATTDCITDTTAGV